MWMIFLAIVSNIINVQIYLLSPRSAPKLRISCFLVKVHLDIYRDDQKRSEVTGSKYVHKWVRPPKKGQMGPVIVHKEVILRF